MTTERIQSAADEKTLARMLALTAADLYMQAGVHIGAPHPEAHAASNGDLVKLGMCIAATAIVKTLEITAEGSIALSDLVYKPRLDQIHGE
jgi:hypothetical protein